MKSYRWPNSGNSALYWQFFSFCSFFVCPHLPPESLDSEGSSIREPDHLLLSMCGDLCGDKRWEIPRRSVVYLHSRFRFVQSFNMWNHTEWFFICWHHVPFGLTCPKVTIQNHIWMTTGHHTKTLLPDCNRNLTVHCLLSGGTWT